MPAKPKNGTAKPSTIDRLLAKRPRAASVGIYLNEEPAERLAQLERLIGDEQADDVRASLEEAATRARADLDEATEWFHFESKGRTWFAELIEAHPPTDEQKAADADAPWNPDTFTNELLAGACISPALTPAEWEQLWQSEQWSQLEMGALFAAAIAVHTPSRKTVVTGAP